MSTSHQYSPTFKSVQSVTYNHFNSASAIVNMGDQLRVNLEYGPDDQRRMAKYWDVSGAEDVLLKTRIYAGSFEKQINADLSEIEVNYISAGGQLVAMYVVEDGVGSYYYPHQDHLGSIIHITDASGDIVYTQSFDAWGRTRNPNDLTYDNIPEGPEWLWRGYTGHEHLDEFGLINMNGRLYDPVVGRMLSPDNYVQSPNFSQSYNRYSYVWNNPLKYTDPSGEYVIVDDIIAAAVGGVVNLAVNAFQGNLSGYGLWETIGRGAAAFGAGAVGGWGALYPEFGGWAWGGATVGATNAWLGGANTAKDIAIGAAVGTVAGMAGGAAGTAAAQSAGVLASQVASPVARGVITGAAAGSVGGYVGGFASGVMLSGGDMDAAHNSGINGLISGFGIGSVAGGVAGYSYARQNNINPWNGKFNVESMPRINSAEIELARYENRQYRSDVSADFNQALKEWNHIQRQYGIEPSQGFPAGFEMSYPNGTRVTGQFYFGGNTNPSGYNIKINTYAPQTINKTPPIYIRYH